MERNSLFGLFKASASQNTVAMELYSSVIAQARQPYFYTDLAVPDTPDGRYDMIMIHAFLILHRLKRDLPNTKEISQALFDIMFEDMDKSLREMGAGDVGIGRRIKEMAKAFYGRIAAYDEGLNRDDDSLDIALQRNVYRQSSVKNEQVSALGSYIRREAVNLSDQPTEVLLGGKLSFADPSW
ncbi:MAG: ubiquinol-cytochrome C chaperone family protein [Rhodospirillales bacterium]|nr:ubiquinol-cytochrome C chaperone family protein [Rhodospirillales bacterium]